MPSPPYSTVGNDMNSSNMNSNPHSTNADERRSSRRSQGYRGGSTFQ